MTKEIIFPRPMECLHIYPNGVNEKVRYGQYASIEIVEENGCQLNYELVMGRHLVKEVTKKDGTRVVFGDPWYTCSKELI